MKRKKIGEKTAKILDGMINRLKQRQKEMGLTQGEFAKFLGIEQSYLSELYNRKKTGEKILLDIFIKANISIDEIIEKNVSTSLFKSSDKSKHNPVPVISWVHAGELDEAVDNWPVGYSGEREPIIPNKNVSRKSFALVIKGDSMYPRYMPEDIIIVDPEVECNNGDYCIVKINNEAIFKQIKYNENEIRLISLNKKYPDIVITKNSEVEFFIIGKVVEMIPNLNNKKSMPKP